MRLDDIYKKVEAWDKEIQKELSETASASINMSGDNAEDVIKLMNALKGEKQADTIDDMPTAIKKGPEMEPVDSMAKLRDLVKGPEQGPMDKPEPMDMKIPMKIGDDEEVDKEVPEEEWDNAPDEDYRDANYMNKTLSGGSEQGVKKSYPKVAGGDNPMALSNESDIDQYNEIAKVYPKIAKMKMALVDKGMEPEDAHDEACEKFDVDPDMCDKYIEMKRREREESTLENQIREELASKLKDFMEQECGCDTHENHEDCNDDCPPHSVNEAKEGKMPSKAHVMKMCKDGMSEAEMLKMHPDADKDKLKQLIKDCKKEMKESTNEGKFKKTGKDGDGSFDESGCVGEMKKLKASGCTKEEIKDKVTEKYGCGKEQFEKLYASNCM